MKSGKIAWVAFAGTFHMRTVAALFASKKQMQVLVLTLPALSSLSVLARVGSAVS
jgi:hypothetical protein